MATLEELIARTVTRLSMVAGVGVQIYAEDRIAEMIWHKFTMVRDELWWDDLMEYQTLTQDADGRPTENVVRELPATPIGDEIVINQYKDIQFAWRPNTPQPLKNMPRRQNPEGAFRPGQTLYRIPDASKVIRFAPFEPGKEMLVRYKKWYPYFLPTDTVPMDDQLMILGATYDYLEDDGTNPGQTEKFRNFFNERLGRLKSQENDEEIPLSPQPRHASNTGWQVI